MVGHDRLVGNSSTWQVCVARIQFLYAIEFTIPMSSTISTNDKYVNAKHQCVNHEWWLQRSVLLFDGLSFLH